MIGNKRCAVKALYDQTHETTAVSQMSVCLYSMQLDFADRGVSQITGIHGNVTKLRCWGCILEHFRVKQKKLKVKTSIHKPFFQAFWNLFLQVQLLHLNYTMIIIDW